MSTKEAILILLTDYTNYSHSKIIEECKKYNILSKDAKMIDVFLIDKNREIGDIRECVQVLKHYAAQIVADKLEKLC